MIVVCTSCQAKFRIPDEKVGPKGAKVRCSKCKTVFVVKREPDAPAPPASGDDPFAAAASSAAAADPFAAASPAPPVAAPDSLAAPGDDPFSSMAVESTGSHLPVTDLADLAGARGPPAAVPPPLPSKAPPPLPSRASPPLPEFAQEPSLPAAPPRLPGEPAPAPEGDAGLSLEESTSARAHVPGFADFAGFDPLGLHAAPGEEPSGLELAGDLQQWSGAAAPEPPAPEITTEVSDAGVPAPPRQASAPVAAATRPPIVAAKPSSPGREAAPEATSGEGRGRLRAVVVNSLSLALLLLVTVAMLALWRGDGTLAQRALGRGRGPPEPVVAAQVTSGLYETANGKALLFVRGVVRSQSAVPLGPVGVRAEIVVADQVVARAEGLAGAVATPEELSGVAGPEDADRLRAALAPRARREIGPGESVPFLLTFTDWPPDLGGATFRVVALVQRG